MTYCNPSVPPINDSGNEQFADIYPVQGLLAELRTLKGSTAADLISRPGG
jgi:hypothetical protein